MRALFLSGVVLVIGALIAQQAVADGGPHRGPSGNHGGSIELAAHHGPHYPGHAGPRYDYRGPRHLPPPPPHYRRPVVVYPPLYAYPAYGPYYYPWLPILLLRAHPRRVADLHRSGGESRSALTAVGWRRLPESRKQDVFWGPEQGRGNSQPVPSKECIPDGESRAAGPSVYSDPGCSGGIFRFDRPVDDGCSKPPRVVQQGIPLYVSTRRAARKHWRCERHQRPYRRGVRRFMARLAGSALPGFLSGWRFIPLAAARAGGH